MVTKARTLFTMKATPEDEELIARGAKLLGVSKAQAVRIALWFLVKNIEQLRYQLHGRIEK